MTEMTQQGRMCLPHGGKNGEQPLAQHFTHDLRGDGVVILYRGCRSSDDGEKVIFRFPYELSLLMMVDTVRPGQQPETAQLLTGHLVAMNISRSR